jgi:hypothetical protein
MAALVYMKGGMREQMSDIFQKYSEPAVFLTGILLVLSIVFGTEIPKPIRLQADSTIGRLFLLGLVAAITKTLGWPLGILAALSAVLLVGVGGVHSKVVENFEPDPMAVRVIPTKHKWFVEKVLGENPLVIEDQTVETAAVQDLSRTGSGNVQNSSVQTK